MPIYNERERRKREKRNNESGWWLAMARDCGYDHGVVAMGFWVEREREREREREILLELLIKSRREKIKKYFLRIPLASYK